MISSKVTARSAGRVVGAAIAFWVLTTALTPVRGLGARLVPPGEVWLDTAGKTINAHGGGMLYHNGTYYWYGENKEGRTWLPESTKPGMATAWM